MTNITTVITSCNRPELLKQTLQGYFKFVGGDYPIIVIDDSGKVGCNAELEVIYPQIQWVYNETNIGQAASIDKAYALVKTPYIFHCEEDWQFYKKGFIEDSLAILEANPKILQVWIRAENDTNGHPKELRSQLVSGKNVWRLKFNHLGKWHGFSFNPGLRRKADYDLIKPYAKYSGGLKTGATAEYRIGLEYYKRGMYAVIIAGNGYVKHIGDGHHVKEKQIHSKHRKASFIIPYRDREEHLNRFLPKLKSYLWNAGIDNYEVLVIEQSEGKPFNRGKVLNIGATLATGDYFIMHDVDMIPMTADYKYSKCCHIATQVRQFKYKMPYPDYFGGVTIFDKQLLIDINGYSNEFWGWGAEDDECLLRVKQYGIKPERRPCRFSSFDHDRDMSNHSKNNIRLQLAKRNQYNFYDDGLSNLDYAIIDEKQIDEKVKIIKVEI